MTFSFWSLDYIYYPVSGIMWVWHKIFGSVLGDSNGWAWVLSVVFLVFTLRAILFKPFMKQMDSQLKMQAIQPEMKRIRAKYKDDRQRLSEEMMKLNKEAGVNPLASCLPALMQAPAFIGLFHVLRNFIPAYQNSIKAPVDGPDFVNNYLFPASDVTSFHDAVLFGGASLSGHLTMTDAELHAINADRTTMIWVAFPLMILAAVATHMTSRKSVSRQKTMGTESSGQMAIMQKLMLWGFPLAVFVIGWIYPLALLFYWLANNSWTFMQLFVAHRAQDRKIAEEAKVVDAAKESTTFTKPKPGARPQRDPKAGTVKPISRNESADSTGNGQATGAGKDSVGKSGASKGSGAASEGARTTGRAPIDGNFLPPPGAAPRPGVKPAQQKKQPAQQKNKPAQPKKQSGQQKSGSAQNKAGQQKSGQKGASPTTGGQKKAAQNKPAQNKTGQAKNAPSKNKPKRG